MEVFDIKSFSFESEDPLKQVGAKAFYAEKVGGVQIVGRLIKPKLSEPALESLVLRLNKMTIWDIGAQVYRHVDSSYVWIERQLSGFSLRQLLQSRGVFSEVQVMLILKNLLLGLVELHEQNIVHSQLSPEHLLLNGEKTQPVDWSCCWSLNGEVWQGMDRLWDPSYCAPEVLCGQISQASDIYVLAQTCCYALTGIDPWEIEFVRGELIGAFDVTYSFAQLIDSMLDSDPLSRPSAVELLDALESLQSYQRPSQNKLVHVGETLALKTVATISYGRSTVEDCAILPHDQGFVLAADDVFCWSVEKRPWYAALWAKLWGWKQQQVVLSTIFRAVGGAADRKRVAPHPFEQALVSCGGSGAVYVWDLKSGKALRSFTPTSKSFSGLFFHPNGKYLCLVAKKDYTHQIEVWDFRLGILKQAIELKGYFRHARFSSTGRYLAVVLGEQVIVYDTSSVPDSWRVEECFQIGDFHYRVSVAWQDGEDLLAVPDASGVLHLIDLCDCSRRLLFSSASKAVDCLTFIPDTSLLVTSCSSCLYVWNYCTGELIQEVKVPYYNKLGLLVLKSKQLLVAISSSSIDVLVIKYQVKVKAEI